MLRALERSMALTYIPAWMAVVVLGAIVVLTVIGAVFCLVVALFGSRIDLDNLERAGRVWRMIAGSPFRRRDDPD